ncbi:hypothetical protein HK405_004874 [Cladochytrium tenue]|nr:hypothetical protein HK405_004874 [Cladochytrium tenue]
MLPADEESFLDIKHEGFTFRIFFDYAQMNNSDSKKDADANPTEPPILIQRIGAGPTSIQWMKDWLRRVSIEFVKYQKSKKRRSRYQYDFESGDWQFIQVLHSSRGLASVALDIADEEALMTDLTTFLADREFYKRMGLPWKRGYMFTGKPGTGKTSLINAISAHYARDIYYMNLKEFENDKQLQNAFNRVPKNAVVVFEDVDAQSRCVWNRQLRRKLERTEKTLIGPTLPGADDDIVSLASEPSEAAVETRKTTKKATPAAKKPEDQSATTDSDDSAIGTEGSSTPVAGSTDASLGVAVADKLMAEASSSTATEDGVDDDDVNVEAAAAAGPPKTKAAAASVDEKDGTMDVDTGEEIDETTRKIMAAAFGSTGNAPPPPPPQADGPTLATLLNCLDGHSLAEGVMIIMTTNHPEVLDPAVVRPGRIDLHLSLGYCTRHQLDRMYKNVVEDDSAALAPKGLAEIPERVVAPCEAMRIMILHRKRPERILPALKEAAAIALAQQQQQQQQNASSSSLFRSSVF